MRGLIEFLIILVILFGLWKLVFPKISQTMEEQKKREGLEKQKPKKFSDLPSPKYANNPRPILDMADEYDNVFSMSYTSDSGRSSYRNFIIEDVYKKHGEWYLDAHDIDKDAPRTFRIDRINSLKDYDDEIFLEFNEILKRLKKG